MYVLLLYAYLGSRKNKIDASNHVDRSPRSKFANKNGIAAHETIVSTLLRFETLQSYKPFLCIALQVSHLATLLNASVGGHDGTNAFYNRLNSRFSGCLEDTERVSIDAVLTTEEATIGSYLKLWSAYLESENAMLHRYTRLRV